MKVTRAVCIPKELDDTLKSLARDSVYWGKDRSVSYVATKLLEKAVENIDTLPINIESRPVKGAKK